jgi:preprotein translocase subunit YajC
MNKALKIVLIVGLLVAVTTLIGGCAYGTTEGEEGSTSILPMIGFLVVIFALFYFVMIRPQRKRQKQHQELMEGLQKGDKVMTAGGIYGTIETLSDDNVVIKVESGATLRVARGSVVLRRDENMMQK